MYDFSHIYWFKKLHELSVLKVAPNSFRIALDENSSITYAGLKENVSAFR